MNLGISWWDAVAESLWHFGYWIPILAVFFLIIAYMVVRDGKRERKRARDREKR
jgi:membrane protein DedA with SNARE-associated domain